MKKRQLGILLFEDVEILDFCGPLEVFSVCNRFTASPAFQIRTIATTDPVTTCNGLSVNPDTAPEDCAGLDILIVPGGIGSRALINDATVIEWIEQTSQRAELVLSVCTGALLLGKAGILDGLEATTHHCAYEELRAVAPTTVVHEDRRFVDNGKVVTSAGIAAGIDMSLHVVERLHGPEVAESTALQMEYPWRRT